MIKKTPPKPSGPGALLPLRLKTTFLISKKSGHLINIIFSSEEQAQEYKYQ